MSKSLLRKHVLWGGSLGLCVGLIMGLSSTPVVGTIIGALAALFATMFGAKGDDLSAFARIGGFGAACVIGVIGGISLRAHNILGTTVTAQVTEWVGAGYDPAIAHQIVLYRELGLLLGPNGTLAETPRSGKVAGSATGGFLSARADEECRQLDPVLFGDDPAKILRSYRNTGGAWDSLSRTLEGLPPDRQKSIVHASWRLACPEKK